MYDAILQHEATGYSYEGGALKKALNWDMSRAGGAGAIYSTVSDLQRWNEAVFNGKVLSQASLRSAWTPVNLGSAPQPADVWTSPR
jgi:CubicO group peptidase (beta-lactamase class C family)